MGTAIFARPLKRKSAVISLYVAGTESRFDEIDKIKFRV
jgi:hypothetical protein